MEYKKLYKKVTVEKANKFSKLAEYVVDNYCSESDGSRIIGNNRSVLVGSLSHDMTLGALQERNRLMKMGIPIGILTVGIGVVAGLKIGRKQVDKRENGIDDGSTMIDATGVTIKNGAIKVQKRSRINS